MDYNHTLEFLYTKLPMYQRQGAVAIKKDLGNIFKLCEALGNPQNQFDSIHIAGTNGKGSVAHFTSAILQAAGYKTGLYTSPHLSDFRERIKVDGDVVSKEDVVEFVDANRKLIEDIQPSFFEITVAMAFAAFAKAEVDIAVVETGLGGRLDSTNILHPIVSVITNIGLDHQAMLGNTLEDIAFEKAGIMKPGVPVLIGELQNEVIDQFRDRALSGMSPLYIAEEIVSLENISEKFGHLSFDLHINGMEAISGLESGLTGMVQLRNLRTVFGLIELLRESGYQDLGADEIASGILAVKTLTGLKGRWDILSSSPRVVADCAHNEAGLKLLFEQVALIEVDRLHLVVGMVADKDVSNLLDLFPKQARYYFCKPDIPRGLDVEILHQKATEKGLKGSVYVSVQQAMDSALGNYRPGDLLLICGSSYVVAEIPFQRFSNSKSPV